MIEALLLDALARTRLGEREAAERSVERALDLAEPQGHVWIWLTVPGARELLGRAPRAPHRARRATCSALLDQLDGVEPARAAGELAEPLNERELTVLRFLPTNLSAAEIGSELFLSVQHGQDPHAQALREARRAHARGGGASAGGRSGCSRRRGAGCSFTRIV